MADEDVLIKIKVPAVVREALNRYPVVARYTKWWAQLWYDNPVHLLVETSLILVILYVVLVKRPSKKKSKLESLPASVVQELIDEFEPEPLCPPVSANAQLILDDMVVLEQQPSKVTRVRGVSKPVLNLATHDFLGLGQREEIKTAANAALDKYGCGSCGPRGFYGSIDVHVFLEQDLAKFFGTEEAIVYSDAASTASSAIPAFSNRADVLVVDDGCNDAIITGVNLSRSRTYFFKHNDMEDLKRCLSKVKEEDERLKRAPQRRFIVCEGLYRNFGDLAPLDEIMKLKQQFKWRLFLDESMAVGVLGATGRGAHDHFGVPIGDVDLVIAALSTTLGSVGGFCVGSREVVDHQRLSGAGYCFSASSPPFVSAVASAAIKVLEAEGKAQLMPQVKKRAAYAHAESSRALKGLMVPTSSPASALMHLRLEQPWRAAKERAEYSSAVRLAEEKTLREIARRARERGFLVLCANYVDNPGSNATVGGSPRPPLPPPSLRLAITALHEEKELAEAFKTLAEVAKQVLDQQPKPAPQPAAPQAEGVKKRK